ncbi:MAG: hypothetical protein GVY05_07645 [Bacteroidetes bacterium]|jgi:hypothetical protein|nr:hypothetical protein [Bacteroidota bacterium]
MRYILYFFTVIVLSCQNYRPPSHDFSNFYGTPAERIVKAIEKNDLQVIKEEANKNEEILNFKDPKYNISLLSIAILNNRKKAFEELLKLGADPNIINAGCGTPLETAIKFEPPNCDLFFINKLVEYGADVRLRHNHKEIEGCNSIYNNNAIIDVIKDQRYNMKCGIKMLRALTAKIGCPDLDKNNNPEDYHQNIIYSCLRVANLEALKFFIMELDCDIPDKIFTTRLIIDGIDKGYFSLIEILENQSFPNSNLKHNEKVRLELVNYLKN